MIRNKLEKLNQRRTDDFVKLQKSLTENLKDFYQTDAIKYIIGTMQKVEQEYTLNTYKEGERVKNQLKTNLTQSCSYEYQGSVTNDTHIKARSDIDLLTIIDKFETLENPQEPKNPYHGNVLEDLKNLRIEEVNILKKTYTEAIVDDSGSKSISISGGSLRRKIDVVPSNWFNSNLYAITSLKENRGIQIYDKDKNIQILNYPFLHNAKIEKKDKECNEGLRKTIRLLKSLKYDSEEIELSSYDIASIAYNMPNYLLQINRGEELKLVFNSLSYCKEIESNTLKRENLFVPNNTRKIFETGGATIKGLKELIKQLELLITDVENENYKSFNKLSEARIDYYF
ncbi:hypothetical protein [Leptospira meyeri]|uniref:hypothetical protein n=1 Tax=Leptospira meyeri TaxID=29508 RepID=UPI000C2B28C4|nr:hypothetical protein [Leptospira meyeri]PJZ95047.1 hypothetical protein CH358_19125 [Leptospira meyeri]